MEGQMEPRVHSTQDGRWSDFLFYWDIFKFLFVLVLRILLFLISLTMRKISQFIDFLIDYFELEERVRRMKEEKFHEFAESELTVKNEVHKTKNNSNDNSIITNEKNNDQQVIESTIEPVRSQSINQDINCIKEINTSNTLPCSARCDEKSILATKTDNQHNEREKEKIDHSVNKSEKENNKPISHENVSKQIPVPSSNKTSISAVNPNDVQHITVVFSTDNVEKNNKDFLQNESDVNMITQENTNELENTNSATDSTFESNLELVHNDNYIANDMNDDECSKTEENIVLPVSCTFSNDLMSINEPCHQPNEEKSNSIPCQTNTNTSMESINAEHNKIVELEVQTTCSESQCTPTSSKRGKILKSRSPIQLITKTLMESLNVEQNKKVEVEVQTTNNSSTAINEDVLAKPQTTTEINDQISVEKFLDNQPSHIEKSDNSRKGPTSNSWPKWNNGGNSEPTNAKDTFYRNVRDQKEYDVEKIDSYNGGGNRRPLMKNERSIQFIDAEEEISNLPASYALARFITADLHMSSDTTIDFQTKYGCTWGELLDQNLKPGDVGVVANNNQYIFFLVVKPKNDQHRMEPVFLDNAISGLASKMMQLKLTKLAVCAKANGLQQFTWTEIKPYFSKYFFGKNISVTECLMPPKDEMKQLTVVNRTPTNLWDIDNETDIIMFINIEEMYKDDWRDHVVDKIDAKYPFKERLLNDVKIKPMAPGDVLKYTVNGEQLICIFVNSLGYNKDRYKCLEQSFNKVKSLLTGYRYLGIQQSSKLFDDEYEDLLRIVLLLRCVFTKQCGEIWMCGDTKTHKIMEFEEYKKNVEEIMNASSTSRSTSNGYNHPHKYGNSRNLPRNSSKRSGERNSVYRSDSSSRYENRRNGGKVALRYDNANLLMRQNNSQSSMGSKFNKTNNQTNKQSALNNIIDGQTLNNKSMDNNNSMSRNDYSENWN